MDSRAHRPISCALYGELELLALRHAQVRIRWEAEGEVHEATDRIRTFTVAGGGNGPSSSRGAACRWMG